MFNITILCASFVILIISMTISFVNNRYYKKCIAKEKTIAAFAEARMSLIKMVNLGEINVNSNYFSFTLVWLGLAFSIANQNRLQFKRKMKLL